MKKVILVVLMGIIAFSLTGCKLIDNMGKGASELESEINEGYENNKENNVDSNGLTKIESLIGKKNSVKNSAFKGDYEATYLDFKGREYIFGGMKVKKQDLTNLTITYSVQKDSGMLSIYILNDEKKIEILNDDLNGKYEFVGNSNSYIVIEGEQFNGKINISIK